MKPALAALAEGQAPDTEDLARAFDAVMDGEASPAQIGAFLMGLRAHMTIARVIETGARALRARMSPVSAPPGAIDVCGTGGDGAHLLNISTAVAFVVAGAGVPVAKHGNRAMSSRAGAADTLEALGVNLGAERAVVEQALAEAGIAFLFAQTHHPAMRHVAPARRELGFRTLFNLLGPLSNPASVRRQMVGVFASDFVTPMAQALCDLGAERCVVLHSNDGLDELSIAAANTLAIAGRDHPLIRREFGVADVGVRAGALAGLRGGDASDNAAALRALLDGAHGPYRDAVVLNAAAALALVAQKTETLAEAGALAEDSLDSGRARRALDRLVAITQRAP